MHATRHWRKLAFLSGRTLIVPGDPCPRTCDPSPSDVIEFAFLYNEICIRLGSEQQARAVPYTYRSRSDPVEASQVCVAWDFRGCFGWNYPTYRGSAFLGSRTNGSRHEYGNKIKNLSVG
ncbi:hypothetical protein BKA66DRAFT_277764 [Pyrenochaeta sp. MPI-SDFR-AT-0127]|nr:hypothetical protein BKA66DRAFT_277764 [Pyrenochaeta sp. MPI-SDFR-AT-0127]